MITVATERIYYVNEEPDTKIMVTRHRNTNDSVHIHGIHLPFVISLTVQQAKNLADKLNQEVD